VQLLCVTLRKLLESQWNSISSTKRQERRRTSDAPACARGRSCVRIRAECTPHRLPPPTVSIIIERLPVVPTSDPFNKAILLGIDEVVRRAGYRVVLEFVSPEETPNMSLWSVALPPDDYSWRR